MKTLKFMPNLVPLVLSGEKTSTWRLFDDKDLKKEDELTLINKETGNEFAKAIITKVEEKKLKDLEDSDFEGHEKYKDEEDMLRHYRLYYGDKADLNTIVKMVNFKLI